MEILLANIKKESLEERKVLDALAEGVESIICDVFIAILLSFS